MQLISELLDVVIPMHFEGSTGSSNNVVTRPAFARRASGACIGSEHPSSIHGSGCGIGCSGASSSGGRGFGDNMASDIGNFELLYDEAVELEAEKTRREVEARRKRGGGRHLGLRTLGGGRVHVNVAHLAVGRRAHPVLDPPAAHLLAGHALARRLAGRGA